MAERSQIAGFGKSLAQQSAWWFPVNKKIFPCGKIVIFGHHGLDFVRMRNSH
jgi:hypothetical protein